MKAAAALVAAWLAAIAVVAFLVADARDTAIERGGRAAAAMAQIMEEQTARTFQAVGVSLAAVADTWELTRPPRNDPKFQAHLAQHLAEIPYARALFIVGRDGSIIHDTDYPETPAGSLADREYFRLHRDNPRVRRSVSAPMLSRTPGAGWFVSVSERIGSGERFEGIVVAAVHPEQRDGLVGPARRLVRRVLGRTQPRQLRVREPARGLRRRVARMLAAAVPRVGLRGGRVRIHR